MFRRAVLLIAPLLASCTMEAAAPEPANPAVQEQMARLLAGKVPGPPMSCIPRYPQQQTDVISPDTIAIRQGSQVYISHFQGSCYHAGSPGYALVFRSVTMSGPCQNDIVEVRDTAGGITIGSCVLGPFIPYNLAR